MADFGSVILGKAYDSFLFIEHFIKFKINMPPLPKTKDLDDIKFKSTGKERDNELAVKLFKLKEHLSSIHDAANTNTRTKTYEGA